MKKLLILFLPFMHSACLRGYRCQCSDLNGEYHIYNIKKGTYSKQQGGRKCAAIENANPTYTACILEM